MDSKTLIRAEWGGGGREGDRQRQTHRERHRQRDRDREIHRDRVRNRETREGQGREGGREIDRDARVGEGGERGTVGWARG